MSAQIDGRTLVTGARTPAAAIASRDAAIAQSRAHKLARKQRKTIAKERHRNKPQVVTKVVSDDDLNDAFIAFVATNRHIWEALSDDQQDAARLNFERYYRGDTSHTEWWASVKLMETELFGAPKEKWQIEQEQWKSIQRQIRLSPIDKIPGGY